MLLKNGELSGLLASYNFYLHIRFKERQITSWNDRGCEITLYTNLLLFQIFQISSAMVFTKVCFSEYATL